jgi:hypothetical protein
MILVAFAIILYLGLSNTEVIAKILKGFFAVILPLKRQLLRAEP